MDKVVSTGTTDQTAPSPPKPRQNTSGGAFQYSAIGTSNAAVIRIFSGGNTRGRDRGCRGTTVSAWFPSLAKSMRQGHPARREYDHQCSRRLSTYARAAVRRSNSGNVAQLSWRAYLVIWVRHSVLRIRGEPPRAARPSASSRRSRRGKRQRRAPERSAAMRSRRRRRAQSAGGTAVPDVFGKRPRDRGRARLPDREARCAFTTPVHRPCRCPVDAARRRGCCLCCWNCLTTRGGRCRRRMRARCSRRSRSRSRNRGNWMFPR